MILRREVRMWRILRVTVALMRSIFTRCLFGLRLIGMSGLVVVLLRSFVCCSVVKVKVVI